MFDDSMVESGGRIQTRKGSTVILSTMVHIVLIFVLIIVPLIFTDQIEGAKLTSVLIAPPPPAAAAPPPPLGGGLTPNKVVKTAPVDPNEFFAPVTVPKEIAPVMEMGIEVGAIGGVLGGVPGGITGGIPGGIPGGYIRGVPGGELRVSPPPPTAAAVPPPPPPVVIATALHHDPIRVGGDVQAGNLIYHPSPAYPALARLARVEGSVVLAATIADDGTIKDLRIMSATNQLLQTGVLDTVKTWKYRPTLLNKEPVAVLTTITVNFTLGR